MNDQIQIPKDRRSAALDFLTQISSSTSSLLQNNLQYQKQATLPVNSQGDDVNLLDSSPVNNIILNTTSNGTTRTLSQRELSVREQAALDFLGNISFTGERGTARINFSDHNIINNENIDDVLIPGDTAQSQPIPIANMLRSGSVASPPFAVPSNLPWNPISGKSDDDAMFSGPFNETPVSQERNSIYRSPGIPRKSLNRLSNKSARSSELSLIDPLYVFTSAGGPVSLFSMIPLSSIKHGEGKRQRQLKKQKAAASPYYFSPYLEKMGLTSLSFDAVKLQRKKVAESFASLLDQQGFLELAPIPERSNYDPYYLDHPDLRTGKNKTVITLPCFLGTIIQPSTASEIKKEINQHFKEAHPDLDSTITLTHIRTLKSSLAKIGVIRDLEPSSVAFAHVYLEKLILKNYLNKINKKLIASCCLLLAVKVNDAKDINYALLVECMEKELEVPRKDIYGTEFSVYTELEFSLFLPVWEVGPHLKRVEVMMEEGAVA